MVAAKNKVPMVVTCLIFLLFLMIINEFSVTTLRLQTLVLFKLILVLWQDCYGRDTIKLLPGSAKQNCASAGNRTRIYCLEGNNANLYTTDAGYLGRKAHDNYMYIPVAGNKEDYSLLGNYLVTMETAFRFNHKPLCLVSYSWKLWRVRWLASPGVNQA